MRSVAAHKVFYFPNYEAHKGNRLHTSLESQAIRARVLLMIDIHQRLYSHLFNIPDLLETEFRGKEYFSLVM